MARIITFSRYLLVAALLACAPPAMAAGGYDGLMAPADDTPSSAPAAAADTQQNAAVDSSIVSAPPPAAAPARGLAEPTAQFTAMPYSKPIRNLRQAALVYGAEKNAPPIVGPTVNFGATEHSLIAGKPVVEYMIGKKIEQAMASVNDESISSSQRAVNAQKAYKNLGFLADGLREKQTVPDNVYKAMNLSDNYISDERSGNEAALSQLDAALAALKPLQ